MAENTTSSKSNFSNLWILLLFLLVIAASIIILKEYWMQYTADAAHLRRKAVEVNTRIDLLQNDINGILSNRNEQQAAEQKQQELKRAYFLAKFAADSLQYSKNTQLAAQLLEAAHNELAASNNADFEKVQHMLQADHDKVVAVKFVDPSVISARIDSLDAMVDSLALKAAPQKVMLRNTNPQTQNKTEALPKWQQAIKNVYDNVKNSVKIRKKSDVELDTAFANLEYKRARFNLLLDEMRWAVYYNDDAVYQRSIKELADLLAKIFDGNNPNVQKFHQTLTELATLQVQPVLPTLQDTINALQAMIVG